MRTYILQRIATQFKRLGLDVETGTTGARSNIEQADS
jgi:hypothetical protein